MKRTVAALVSAAFLLTGPAAVAASPKGVATSKVPSMAGKKHDGLELRIVRYDGDTNGGMVVDVQNTGQAPREFVAKGLYFVPQMDPDQAPQRLGAAGPFEKKQDNGAWDAQEQLTLRPGEKARLRLNVFCIDSHRSSPNAKTPFKLASKRLPKQLRQKIEGGTKRIMASRKAKSAAEVKGAVQSHVWESRDSAWIKLQGERSAEKSPRQRLQRLQRNDRLHKTPQRMKALQ